MIKILVMAEVKLNGHIFRPNVPLISLIFCFVATGPFSLSFSKLNIWLKIQSPDHGLDYLMVTFEALREIDVFLVFFRQSIIFSWDVAN